LDLLSFGNARAIYFTICVLTHFFVFLKGNIDSMISSSYSRIISFLLALSDVGLEKSFEFHQTQKVPAGSLNFIKLNLVGHHTNSIQYPTFIFKRCRLPFTRHGYTKKWKSVMFSIRHWVIKKWPRTNGKGIITHNAIW